MTESNQSESMPNGAAWAAIVAAGIGCVAYGLFIDLAEGSKFFGRALNLYDPVGNLSGKTTYGILVWLIAWGVLHLLWRRREIKSTCKLTAAALILVLLGVIMSCPLFFGLFAAT